MCGVPAHRGNATLVAACPSGTIQPGRPSPDAGKGLNRKTEGAT